MVTTTTIFIFLNFTYLQYFYWSGLQVASASLGAI